MNFIQKAKKVHGAKYDYSLVNYINCRSKVIIICHEHGKFTIRPTNHLSKQGCKKCAKKSSILKHTINTKNFIQKAKKVHGTKYDYSLVNYTHNKINVIIICHEHGKFKSIPNNHLQGSGCSKCGRKNQIKKSSLNQNDFIKKAKLVHNNKYDYKLSKYKNHKTKIDIICKKHGKFKQSPNKHLSGQGCIKCGIENASYKNTLTLEKFIERAKLKHKEKYDYTSTNYINNCTHISIICPKHGKFKQLPSNHLYGKGCQKCPSYISKPQLEIVNFIKSLKISNIIINDRSIIKPLELDILLPDYNLAIEHHGLYYHSFNKKETQEEKFYHSNKLKNCIDNGLMLLQIFENEWRDKQRIIKSIIKSKLNKNEKIFARKCKIKPIDQDEYMAFITKCHIQNAVYAKIKYGLYYDNKLKCAMGFNKHMKYEWELSRFVNDLNINIVGGASRLFKHFIRNHNPKTILSYADKRYSIGNLYNKLGFTNNGTTNPGYFYTDKNNLYNRQKFQKHKLSKRLKKFDSNKSEIENMFFNNYRRIWDAGHFRFIWIADRVSRPCGPLNY